MSREMMIQHIEVNESNWLKALKIELHDYQQKYVATPEGILARAYVYRHSRPKVNLIIVDSQVVGMFMIRDLDDYPSCYDLQQFMIDKNHQGKGYGYQSLKLLISELEKEKKYPRIDLSVDKEDKAALNLYKKVGFVDTGYVDEASPNALNLTYIFL